jgi:hypothetical protein
MERQEFFKNILLSSQKDLSQRKDVTRIVKFFPYLLIFMAENPKGW